MCPTVSVVIPVFNSEKYIEECLQSVINQTYPKLEIICVNDGSTDNSLAILEKIKNKDRRIKLYTKENEKNSGAAGARNYGLERATGEYIMFLDSDDFFEAEMIENLVDSAERNESQVVICAANTYDDQLKEFKEPYRSIRLDYAPKKPYFNYRDCPEHIFMIGEMIVWNKLFRLDFIRYNSLYFEAIPISDDQYLPNLAMVLANRISVVDSPFVNYRVNTGTNQVSSQNKHPKSAYLATISVVNKMREIGVYEDVKRCYINMVLRLMREYFDRMTDYENLSLLYSEFKEMIFPFLGAENLSSDYFYDSRLADWYKLIQSESLENILMMIVRGYGSNINTGILRFQVPYDTIEKGSKIILIGKGLVGKYWYAQLILSDYAEVVAWLEDDIDAANYEYDQCIYAE